MGPKRLTREESRQRTKDRLLAAAAELFAERGVTGTSIEQIAERAGYTRGAFYGNFADKHEVVRELLLQRTRTEMREVEELSREAQSFGDLLDLLRAWNRARAQHLTPWLSLRLELLLHALRTPQLRPDLADRELLARDAIGDGIRRELARRNVRPPADPAFLALVVHSLEDGLLIQHLLRPEEISGDVVVDAVELLLDSWAALGAATPGPNSVAGP
ncbi:TetR/AcrR family transcriptional regulator [Streptomyces coeruleoprunus]|uniref:TetR/AcrR family transcriptional regulator n=1 Tax=Streptomyces coeruleoprunus TaxID=285563 RepID=A0ABV9XF17_9ACTN